MQGDTARFQEVNTAPLLRALAQAGVPYTCDEPLAKHTTFRIGGPAAVFCTPRTAHQLTAALTACRAAGVRQYLLGNGSNVLFADEGFAGVVLCTAALSGAPVFAPLPGGGARVAAPAGLPLAALCRAAQAQGLAGLEFAYGIPGTVGGAVYMNAGAYGGEMRDVLESVRFADETGAQRTLPAGDLALGYRTSAFEARPWCILEASFALRPGDPQAILAQMQEFMRRRREKQPLDLPSAGSTFKRPAGAFAGRLIEDCGLRGYTVGGAAVSEKHCGFVVNKGGATCADVLRLTDAVRRIVLEKTGYTLEREIRVVE